MKKYTDEEYVRKITEHIEKFYIKIGEPIRHVKNNLIDYLTEMSFRHGFTFKINEFSSNLCKITLNLNNTYVINYNIS